eukprot:3379597-Rhodomonas_salina.1
MMGQQVDVRAASRRFEVISDASRWAATTIKLSVDAPSRQRRQWRSVATHRAGSDDDGAPGYAQS